MSLFVPRYLAILLSFVGMWTSIASKILLTDRRTIKAGGHTNTMNNHLPSTPRIATLFGLLLLLLLLLFPSFTYSFHDNTSIETCFNETNDNEYNDNICSRNSFTSSDSTLPLSDESHSSKSVQDDTCGVWFAKSTIPGAGLGMFAGRDFQQGQELLASGDVVTPIVDSIQLMNLNINNWDRKSVV